MNTTTLNNLPLVEKWNTFDGHSPIVHFLKQLFPISELAIDYIDKCTFRCDFKKGKHLIKVGELCKDVYFVQNGVIRAYFKDGNKEITTWITGENSFVTSVRSFYLQIPSIKNIQAIEDCELIGLHYNDLQFLYENYIEMNIVGRKLLEIYYNASEERVFISRLPTAAGKYYHFLETNNALANRIKLKYIASFLGMTIETLSRIRSRKVIVN
jgi:CRP-like cAMP-binding protein